MGHRPRSVSGFSLFELAIVIAIIGLLMGAIVIERDLVKNAEIRSQIRQLTQYESAALEFEQKYNCKPGDCANASSRFSGVSNGNGNGYIETSVGYTSSYDYGVATWSASTEIWSFFVHLSKANLIDFQSDGSRTVGLGVPPLAMNEGASFFANDMGAADGWHDPWLGGVKKGKNALWLMSCNIGYAGSDLLNYWDDFCGIFTAAEAQAIDVKMDDGRPLKGNIWAFNGYDWSGRCIGGTEYFVSSATWANTKVCQMAYIYDQ